jgi:hypothetical protein
MAYLKGHSFVVRMGEDPSHNLTGEFEMHNVPPGTYDLIVETFNYKTMMEVEVLDGQVTEVDPNLTNLCFQD